MENDKEFTKEQATAFFAEFYRGDHNIPGQYPKPWGNGWVINHDRGGLATYDFNQLTRLVLMAHEQCIRVEVSAARNNILRICVWKREGTEGSMVKIHPTIEQAIESFRNNPQPTT